MFRFGLLLWYFIYVLFCALFVQVDLKFSLGEEKTTVLSKISVFPRVEGKAYFVMHTF